MEVKHDLEQAIAGALCALLPPRAGVSVRAIPETAWPRNAIESATGLWCAAEAIARAGAPDSILEPTNAGPIWPNGFVGSISHDRRIAIAAAAPVRACASVGIDIEPVMTFERAESVVDVIAGERERLACRASPWRLTLLFSAKESLFKCLSPIVRTWFDFDDAEIVGWNDRERTADIALLRDLGSFERGTVLTVRYAHVAQRVLTTVVLEAS